MDNRTSQKDKKKMREESNIILVNQACDILIIQVINYILVKEITTPV